MSNAMMPLRHTHCVTHATPDGSYSDSFLCTPPEGCGDALAWAVDEVARRRPGHAWDVTVKAFQPRA